MPLRPSSVVAEICYRSEPITDGSLVERCAVPDDKGPLVWLASPL